MLTRTTELTRSARRLARAMATCWVAVGAATAAHAEFVVTHPQPIPIDSNVPYFFTGPFNFSPEAHVTGGGVPEPTSMAMCAVGLIGLWLRTQRRRTRH